MIKIIPPFTGSEATRGACETLALQRVDEEIRAQEVDLYSTKWFDYRIEHWVHSTYRYAHEYRNAARSFCRTNNDIEKAEALKLFSSVDIFQCKELTACINARQALDRIGCRYEWALTWMLKRFSDRGWLAFPRPNQIYSEELMMDVRDHWEEECKASLQIARNAHFQVAQQGPLQPVQREYTTWLMDQARSRGVDSWRPLSRMLSEGVVRPEDVGLYFSWDILERAQRTAAMTS